MEKDLKTILQFEKELAKYTGAPYAIMTDCCTHAIELCLRYCNVTYCEFTPYTYLSIPMTMHKLGIGYHFNDEVWYGEYKFHGTHIWDSARMLQRNMYRPNMMQCLSFGYNKPLTIGRGGAILLDSKVAYNEISRLRYDGRDISSTEPWHRDENLGTGFHYRPTIEEAERGLELLKTYELGNDIIKYPDLRNIKIKVSDR